jgi:hypothetical protein
MDDGTSPPLIANTSHDTRPQLIHHESVAETTGTARHSAFGKPETLAGDILYGAEAIAEFMYGRRQFRRRVYNLVERGRLPHFKLGAGICSRKSVLRAWISDQERLANGPRSALLTQTDE